jgi:hypothetical protein
MTDRSFANGNGNSHVYGPDMRLGSPVPFWLRNPEWLMARAVSTTFWELI